MPLTDSRPRVLVVEDRAHDRLYLTNLLGSDRFVVTEAVNGEEGLAAANTGPFDLVISDVLMPKMDGFEFVRRLRRTAAGADLPVLFHTGTFHEHAARALAEECGVVDILIKPCEPRELLAKVDAVLSRGRVPIRPIEDEPFARRHAALTNETLIENVRALAASERRLAALVDIGQRLTEEHDPVALLDLFCTTVRESTLATYAMVALFTNDTSRFSLVVTKGHAMPIAESVRALPNLPPLIRQVANERQTVRRTTANGLPQELSWHPPVSSVLIVPLARRDKVLGVIAVADKIGAPEFSEADEQLAVTLGTQAGIAYENARLINELEAAATTLRAREAATEFALSAAGVGIYEHDLVTNESRHSKGLAQLLKVADASTTGDLFQVLDADDRQLARQTIEQAVQSGSDFTVNLKGTLPGGTAPPHFQARGQVETDAQGLPARLVSVIIDMTERRELEGQLRQAQKMEAIGQLASGVAHDFNNLLTVIQGYSLFLIDSATDEEQRRDATAISDAGKRAASLTRQLLTFSRSQISEVSVFDLNALITELAGMLKRLIGDHIRLTTELGSSLGTLREDRGQIGQLIMNLVVNARDAMPSGGEVRIETSAVTEAGHHWVRLAISDTGTGMTDAVKARLFEPFFTTKEVGKGTGLGLATVAGIVRNSGGQIRVESRLGQGSTFVILLPRQETTVTPTAIEAPPIVGGTEAVLLVEDEVAIRVLAQQVLERAGYMVVAAVDAAGAIAAAGRQAFDLVVSDVLLPDGVGPDLFRRLSAMQPALRVLYASGYAPEETLDVRKLHDRAGFLAKPFTPEALTRKVREVLDR
jgi:signal transduction histidine kinase/DNA-binding response OmpR family regulator